MIARAPGKLVLSGAYAVLEGAPALVAAVDRYVTADSSRTGDLVTPEVRWALGDRSAPFFDASALRHEGRKLGLGSSAAIVVASLAAIELDKEPELADHELAQRVFPVALRAHREAQGGGSGIDVAASAWGGVQRCQLVHGQLQRAWHELAPGTVIEVLAAGQSCRTSQMLQLVRAYAAASPGAYGKVMQQLKEAAQWATQASTVQDFVSALVKQAQTLSALGDAAGAPIVPMELRQAATRASSDGVALLPSGAGGGDVVLCVGTGAASRCWAGVLQAAGMMRLGLTLGARGVHRVMAAG